MGGRVVRRGVHKENLLKDTQAEREKREEARLKKASATVCDLFLLFCKKILEGFSLFLFKN